MEEVAPRSFNIKIPGRTTLRRNQRQLRRLHSTTSTFQPNDESDTETIVGEDNEHQESDDSQSTLSADSDATQPYDEDSDFDRDELFELKQNITRHGRTTRSGHYSRSGRKVKNRAPLDYEEI